MTKNPFTKEDYEEFVKIGKNYCKTIKGTTLPKDAVIAWDSEEYMVMDLDRLVNQIVKKVRKPKPDELDGFYAELGLYIVIDDAVKQGALCRVLIIDGVAASEEEQEKEWRRRKKLERNTAVFINAVSRAFNAQKKKVK